MIITDKDLGEIKLVKNSRAKRIIVRKKDNYLQLTYPPSASKSYILKTIEEMKPRLIKMVDYSKQNTTLFTPETQFSTFSFTLRIIENTVTENYYLNLKDGILSISCPENTNYNDDKTQIIIKSTIEKAFRYEANRIFPIKVKLLAEKFNFIYSGVKINKSRTRWGSCSSKKSINLSYYCMLLPEYLADFIILHELCHTIEMNHGPRFWELLDKVTGNKAKQFTKELKYYNTQL